MQLVEASEAELTGVGYLVAVFELNDVVGTVECTIGGRNASAFAPLYLTPSTVAIVTTQPFDTESDLLSACSDLADEWGVDKGFPPSSFSSANDDGLSGGDGGDDGTDGGWYPEGASNRTSCYGLELTMVDATQTLVGVLVFAVNDANDNPPIFAEALYTAVLSNVSIIGTAIATVATSDADADSAPPSIEVDPEDPLYGTVFVDEKTGEVSLRKSLPQAGTFLVKLLATDSGDATLSTHSWIKITVLADSLEHEPQFEIVGNMRLIGATASMSNLAYSHDFGLGGGGTGATSGSGKVKARFGSLIESAAYTTTNLKEAFSVNGVLQQQDLYHDAPTVAGVLQIRDVVGATRTLPTKVKMRAELVRSSGANIGIFSPLDATCTKFNSNGICVVTSSSIPQQWFTDANLHEAADKLQIQVSAGLSASDSSSYAVIGTVTVHQYTLSNVPDVTNGVRIVLPSYPLYRGDQFTFIVSGHALFQIETFNFRIKVGAGLLISKAVPVDSSQFSLERLSNAANDWTIAGRLLGSGTAGSNIPAEKLIAVTVTVQSSASVGASTTVSCSVWPHGLTNVKGEDLFPAGTQAEVVHRSTTSAGDISSGSGSVFVEDDATVGIFASSDNPEIVGENTLLGRATGRDLRIIAASASGTIAEVTNDAMCKSSNADVIAVASGSCSSIDVAARWYSGSNQRDVAVTATYASKSASQLMHVWSPVLQTIDVHLEPSTLSAVKHWLNPNDCSKNMYQSGTITAVATFTDGVTELAVVITDLISGQLRLANESVAAIRTAGNRGLECRGAAAGETDIELVVGGDVVAAAALSVNAQEVKVVQLEVKSAAAINVNLPGGSKVAVLDRASAVAEVITQFTKDGEEGTAVIRAMFEDGTIREVTASDGATLASLNSEIATVSGANTIVSIGSGSGDLLHAVWKTAAKCNARLRRSIQNIGEGFGSLDIAIPNPDAVQVTFSAPKVAPAGDPALLDSMVAPSTSISIVLVYPGGHSVDYSTDPRVRFDLAESNNLFTVESTATDDADDGSSSHAVVPIGGAGSSGGTGYLTVYFTHTNVTARTAVHVVQATHVKLFVSPYPAYLGSTGIPRNQLHAIAETGYQQQAVVNAQLILSDGAELDVSRSKHLKLDLEDEKDAIDLSNRIISRKSSGANIASEGTLTGIFGKANTPLPWMINLNVTKMYVTRFTSVRLPSNTINSPRGQPGAYVSVGAMLDDGSIYTTLMNSGSPVYPNLLNFTSNALDAATIGLDSGRVTLVDNHVEEVAFTVQAHPNGVTGTVAAACNVMPSAGEVDVGTKSGVPLPSQRPGETFTTKVYINSGSSDRIGSIDLKLAYDEASLSIVSAKAGSNWPSNAELIFSINDPPGVLGFGGALSGQGLKGSYLHIATLQFKVKSAVPTPSIVEMQGTIVTLADLNGKLLKDSNSPFGTGSIEMLVEDRRERRQSVGAPPPTLLPLNGGLLVERFGPQQQTDQRHRRAGTCKSPPCNDGACLGFGKARETGDADGNCIFDIRDVRFTMQYIVHAVNGFSGADGASFESNLLDSGVQQRAMDPDGTGNIDGRDSAFLARANFNLLRFVANLETAAVQDQASNCSVLVRCKLLEKGDAPATGQTTKLYFDIAHPQASFGASLAQAVVAVGSVAPYSAGSATASSPKGKGLHGWWCQAADLGNGVFECRLNDVEFTFTGIGVSLLIVTTDQTGETTAFRNRFLDGSSAAPFEYSSRLDASVGELDTEVYRRKGYNPFIMFDQTVASSRCTNDFKPEFSESIYAASIFENADPAGTVVVEVVDRDIGGTAPLELKIDQDVPFELVASNGIGCNASYCRAAVRAVQKFDFEHDPRLYEFTVSIKDQSLFDSNSVASIVRITILDENDNSPTFVLTERYSAALFEHSPLETFVGSVSATDKDEDGQEQIVYTFSDPAPEAFTIDKDSGVIKVAADLDREAEDGHVHVLNIIAADVPQNRGATPNTVNTTFKVTILDINDHTPTFTQSTLEIAINENTAAGTSIAALVASADVDAAANGNDIDGSGDLTSSSALALYSFTDFDLDENANVTLSLESPTTKKGQRYFEIDPSTGLVTIEFTPDYEEDSALEYNFTITATDNGDPVRSSSITFAVFILDLNDNEPTFSKSAYKAIIERSENIAPNRLLVLKVADADTTPAFAVLSDETQAGLSNISAVEVRRPTPGVIEVWLVEPADHADNPSIFFNITVTDVENPSFTATADVEITIAEPLALVAKASNGGFIASQPELDSTDFNVYTFASGYFIDSLSSTLSIEYQSAKTEFDIDVADQVKFEVAHYGFLLDEMMYTNSLVLGEMQPKVVKVYAQLTAKTPERVPFPEYVEFTLGAWMSGESGPALTVKALVDQDTGISESEIAIPISWQDTYAKAGFTDESVLSVLIVGAAGQSRHRLRQARQHRRRRNDVLGAKTLSIAETPPAPSLTGSASSPSVWLIAPSEGIHVHESTNISVHAHAPQGLSSFVVRFEVSPYLRLRSFFPASDDDWLLVVQDRKNCPSYAEGGDPCTPTITLSGSRTASSSNATPQPGTLMLLAKILVDFVEPDGGGPVPTGASHAMSFEFLSFIPTEDSFEAGHTPGTVDRSGTKAGSSTVQIHALERDRILALSLTIPHSELVNSAVLTGVAVGVELRIYTHRADMIATSASPAGHLLDAADGGVTCAGSNDNVAVVAADCSGITMVGTETEGAERFVVTAVHSKTGIETSISLRIWFPTGPAVLSARHDAVQQIRNWPTKDCVPGSKTYQETTVSASMLFTDSKISFKADITPLVASNVQNSHPEIGSLRAAPVSDDGKGTAGAPLSFVGLRGPGSATLTLSTHNGSWVSNNLVIAVGGDDGSVTAAGLLVTVLAELQLLSNADGSVDDTISHDGRTEYTAHAPTTFKARALRGVHAIGVPYRYTAYVVCSDGRTMPVDASDGLSWNVGASYRHVRINETHVVRKENAPKSSSPEELGVAFSFQHACASEDGSTLPPSRRIIAKGSISTGLRPSTPPTLVSNEFATLDEGVYAFDDDRLVATMQATDPDIWRYDPIFFAIISMNYTSLAPVSIGGGDAVVVQQPQPRIDTLFNVDSLRGTISVVANSELDFEQMHTLSVAVAVTNSESTARLLQAGSIKQGNNGLVGGDGFTVGHVHITLLDINDNAPVLPESPRVRLLPTTQPGVVIHNVGGTDADSTNNAQLEYSLISETPPGLVTVDGPSGLVVLKEELPRGLLYSEVGVRAVDNGEDPSSRATNGTIFLEVFDPEYLVQIDLDMSPAVFGMIKNDFAAVIGAQIGVAVHLAGEQIQVGDGDNAQVRTFVVHVLEEYRGLDHAGVLDAIAQVPLLTVYGGMLSQALADLLAPIDFQKSFGAGGPGVITAFNYTSATDWGNIIELNTGSNGTGIDNATLLTAAAKKADVGLGVGLGVIVFLAVLGIVVGVVMQRNRQNEHDRQLRHLLEGSSAAQSGMIGGALFSFSGGEVDPMTGDQFFQDYQTKAGGFPLGGLPPSPNAFGMSHPTAATAEELQSDFGNPLFDENAPVGAASYGSENRPGTSFSWMQTPANPLFGLDEDGDGVVGSKEMDDAALLAAGLPNRNFAPLVTDTQAPAAVPEAAFVAGFQSYLAGSDAY